MPITQRLSLFAITVTSSLMSAPIWAATSAELHLTDLQYTLMDNVTGQPSTKTLTLVPNTYAGPDGSMSTSARVWEADPYVVNEQSFYDQPATVPLTPSSNISATANLPRASASTLVRTSAGKTNIDAQGQHSGDGTFSSNFQLTQGGWGLYFGPAGQGLLLPAQTTITVSANVQGAAQIDGLCPLSTGLAPQWCDNAGAFAYIELAYLNPSDQSTESALDELNISLLTESIGQARQQTDSKTLSISVSNTSDESIQIAFRYYMQLSGRSVPSVVPEPSAWVMMGMGLLALSGVLTHAKRKMA